MSSSVATSSALSTTASIASLCTRVGDSDGLKFLFSASVNNDSLYLEASLEVAEASLEASTLLTSSITVVRSAVRTNERNGGVDLRVT